MKKGQAQHTPLITLLIPHSISRLSSFGTEYLDKESMHTTRNTQISPEQASQERESHSLVECEELLSLTLQGFIRETIRVLVFYSFGAIASSNCFLPYGSIFV